MNEAQLTVEDQHSVAKGRVVSSSFPLGIMGGSIMSPRWQLLVDFALILLFCALDARDLGFRTMWIGPNDSYSFATFTNYTLAKTALEPTMNATIPDQKIVRASGWTSFLNKCGSIQPFRSSSPSVFSLVLARDCDIGRPTASHVVPTLVLSGAIRADAMGWVACRMLYHHRKPAICHSPAVRLFQQRYNMHKLPAPLLSLRGDKSNAVWTSSYPLALSTPGSDSEMELIELLEVIGKSSPLHRVVCVEGFQLETHGANNATIFGCASPNRYHSAFIGHHNKKIRLYLQDKAGLSIDVLHLFGMSYGVRENRRSVFNIQSSMTINSGQLAIEQTAQLNFSSFGALYKMAVLIDAIILVVNAYSAIQIGQLMLIPLWKSLKTVESSIAVASSAKLIFAARDCRAVLTASLYRSSPMVALYVISRFLHWITSGINGTVLIESTMISGQLHATLSLFRYWVLVLIILNAFWDVFVVCHEKWTSKLVRSTYITVTEIGVISSVVGYALRSSLLVVGSRRHELDGQRLSDTTSFVGETLVANGFSMDIDSRQNSGVLLVWVTYSPLAAWILLSLNSASLYILSRFVFMRLWYPDLLKHHHSRLFICSSGPHHHSPSIVRPDLRGDSPTKRPNEPSTSPARTNATMTSGEEHDVRLPLEKVVNRPLRAQSMVRNGWELEKKIGHQVFLRPPLYLEHGIILEDGGLKTRFGFMDVVHPYLRAESHAMSDELAALSCTKSSSSSPLRRVCAGEQTKRNPLVPLR